MNSRLLASLPEAERDLVLQTGSEVLPQLSEDEVAELHTRLRKARNKHRSIYRRSAAARVEQAGARGTARPKNLGARERAEVLDEALVRVNRQLAKLAKQEQEALRQERLAEARAVKGSAPASSVESGPPSTTKRAPRGRPPKNTGNRSLQNPSSKAQRASTRATGARRQAKRDSR